MRHRGWGLLLLLPAALFAAMLWRTPFSTFHSHLVFAGTPKRFAATIVRAGRADARGAIWLDNVFVLSWLLVVPRLMRAGLERWCPERRRRFGFWYLSPRFALIAAALAVVENVTALALVGKHTPPTLLTLVVCVAGWSKWVFYGGALVGLFGLVIGPLLAPIVRPALRVLFGSLDRAAGHEQVATSATTLYEGPAAGPVEPSNAAPAEAPTERIGICVSGGGMRAASVALGALRELDRPDGERPSVFRRARWLSAVSGGAQVAGGWRISRGRTVSLAPLPDDVHDGLFAETHPWATTVRRRRRFLANGVWSSLGGVINLVVRSIGVLGGLFAATYLIGWFAGHAVRTRAMHSWFPFSSPLLERRLAFGDLFPLRIAVPGAVWLCVGVMVLLASMTRQNPDARARARSIAMPLVAVGITFVVLMVGIPAALIDGPSLLRRLPVARGADEGALMVAVVALAGVVVSIVAVVRSRRKTTALRLGAVFLALTLVMVGGKVATAIAYRGGGLWGSWPIGASYRLPIAFVAFAWLVVLDCIAAHRRSLAGLYRKRLAATFAVAGEAPFADADEPEWPAYVGAGGPELIVAATALSSARTFSGVRAHAVTYRPDRITLFDRTDGTSAAVATGTYPVGSWWDGHPSRWTVSRAMALTSGALASTMGQASLDSTQSLLVALDLRLGMWVPNPRFVEWFADPNTAPRVHLGYLAKELFGRYDPTQDAFVYVTDGGHRDNLGLVELLRERPDVVCCIDASADPPGSFRTLREAIELASVELDVDIEIDLRNLRSGHAETPRDCATVGSIAYPTSMGGGTGRLLYGRYQLSDAAPADLVRYGAAHPRFPTSTAAEQRRSDDEHLQLVALGEHVGARIASLMAGVTA